MSLPATSLIIPSRDRPEFLTTVVESVLSGEEIPDEIVVVDQSRVPHAMLQARAEQSGGRLQYVWSRTVGLSRGRNIGIQAAKHDVLVFGDDDFRVTPTWFGELVRALIEAGPRSVVVGVVLAGEPETRGFGFAPSIVNSTVPHPVVFAGRPGREVLSANMALCRSSFDEIGLFDERLGAGSKFPGAEDNDLCFRLFEAGYRVLRLPNAAVYHRAWRGRWDYVPLYWGYGRGQGAYFAKHLSLRDRYMLRRLRADVTRHLGRIPRRVRAGMYRDAGGDLAFALGMLTGAAQWLLTERQTRPR